MTEDNPNDLRGRPKMAHAVRTMPKWKWTLLAFSLVLGCVGLIGQGASMFFRAPAPVTHATSVSTGAGSTPGESSGFVSGQSAGSTSDMSTPQTTPTEPSMTDKLTPFMSKFGFSLFIGVVVGLIFRTFIRLTVIVLALIMAAGLGLAYFHINVDMSAFKADTSQATSWLTEQGYRLKDMLFHALPSSTAAGVGFFLGFKKR